jgi:hypothetical protein
MCDVMFFVDVLLIPFTTLSVSEKIVFAPSRVDVVVPTGFLRHLASEFITCSKSYYCEA